VPLAGQRLTIRIITADYLKVQHVHRYRYEVMSRASRAFGNVDFAYSDDPTLRPGHTHYVTMGNEGELPWIAKRHREVVADKARPDGRKRSNA
jgi:hypothetical protein